MAMTATMGKERYRDAENLLRETGALISLPEVCLKLRRVLADPGHSRREIADIIIHDPSLTTRLLRIVNSAYYGPAQPIRDIDHALSILGEEELNNLVIVTSIVKTMKSIQSHMDINCFWRSSIFSAVMASNLAKHYRRETGTPHEYFIAGLLLNIGKLLLYYCEPELLAAVEREMADSHRPDYKIEREQLGFDHADVGAVMAEKWNFPVELKHNISRHHDETPEKAGWEQAVMYLAGYFSDQFDFIHPKQLTIDELQFHETELLERLSMTEEEFCVLLNNSYEGYLKAYEAFCGGQV